MQKFLFFCLVALVVIVATTPKTHVHGRTMDASNKNALAFDSASGLLETKANSVGRTVLGRSLTGYTSHRSRPSKTRHSHHRPHHRRQKGGHYSPRRRYIRRRSFWYDLFMKRRQRYAGHRSRADSASISRLKGVLIIVAYGDGEMCLTKVIQRGMGYNEQFGDSSTSTSGFIDLYGEAECEEGAKGYAYGVVKASVLAEAKRRGGECEAKVVAEVMVRVHDPDPDDGVNVLVGGAAGGEALAVCN